MKSVKDILTAVFFLVCFTGCIATNCVKNVKILIESAKVKQEDPSASATVISKATASVFFLMDKKESETQKYSCPHLFVSISEFRSTCQITSHCEVAVRSGKLTPIYIEVHNYRI